MQLHHGIPTEYDYRSLIETVAFKEMESFSNYFLQTNQKNLGKYAKRWVKDPLHQWSRQWEYPYVFNQIQTVLSGKDKARILDAGSGITFFPYYIKSKVQSADIYCTDFDESLENIYQRINAGNDDKVAFSSYNLKKLPYEDDWFDIIYCISVLEHTDDYQKIIDVFQRILRPGGSLVITFDVSLDGTRDITIEKGNLLLHLLAEKFAIPESFSIDLESHLTDVFTTITAKHMDPKLLPWKLPAFLYQIEAWITGKQFVSWPPLLSVCCLTSVKRMSNGGITLQEPDR